MRVNAQGPAGRGGNRTGGRRAGRTPALYPGGLPGCPARLWRGQAQGAAPGSLSWYRPGAGSHGRDVAVDFRPVPLRNALCDPHDVPHLLLPQLRVGVEHAEVELPVERQDVQAHLTEAGKFGHNTRRAAWARVWPGPVPTAAWGSVRGTARTPDLSCTGHGCSDVRACDRQTERPVSEGDAPRARRTRPPATCPRCRHPRPRTAACRPREEGREAALKHGPISHEHTRAARETSPVPPPPGARPRTLGQPSCVGHVPSKTGCVPLFNVKQQPSGPRRNTRRLRWPEGACGWDPRAGGDSGPAPEGRGRSPSANGAALQPLGTCSPLDPRGFGAL